MLSCVCTAFLSLPWIDGRQSGDPKNPASSWKRGACCRSDELLVGCHRGWHVYDLSTVAKSHLRLLCVHGANGPPCVTRTSSSKSNQFHGLLVVVPTWRFECVERVKKFYLDMFFAILYARGIVCFGLVVMCDFVYMVSFPL